MVDGILYKDGVAQIYTHCTSCQKQFVIKAPQKAFNAWANGEAKIQQALPMLCDDDRELLLSNTCPRCFAKLFK